VAKAHVPRPPRRVCGRGWRARSARAAYCVHKRCVAADLWTRLAGATDRWLPTASAKFRPGRRALRPRLRKGRKRGGAARVWQCLKRGGAGRCPPRPALRVLRTRLAGETGPRPVLCSQTMCGGRSVDAVGRRDGPAAPTASAKFRPGRRALRPLRAGLGSWRGRRQPRVDAQATLTPRSNPMRQFDEVEEGVRSSLERDPVLATVVRYRSMLVHGF
jgi:hypothetical protein